MAPIRRKHMGWGFVVVVALAIAAIVTVNNMAKGEEREWINERGDVAAENAGRIGTRQEQLKSPDAPLIVAHTGLVAFGAALVVAVVGTIIVLLAVIATKR
jgi:hypothetical protein